MNEVNIMNIGGIDHEIDDQRARDVIAHSENGLDPQSNLPISSRHYDEGDYLIGQDRMYYEVTAEINIGDVMAVGTNLRATIVSEEIVRLKNQSALAVIQTIAYCETGALSTKAYSVGDYMYWDYGLNAGLYEVISPIILNDAFAINTNIKAADTITTMIQDVNDEISDIVNIFGSKNLCPNTATTQVVNGVSFTVNSDGSVTVNGTATATTYMRFSQGFNIKRGKYIYTSTPSSTPEDGAYGLGCEMYSNNSWVNLEWGEGGTREAEYEFSNDAIIRTYIAIGIGKTINNITFYPMIRPANIKDDTYVPFAMNNYYLTKNGFYFINVPYNNFTWDSSAKVFTADLPNYYGTIAGILCRPTNGNAVITAYITSQRKINVMGVIPSTMRSITNDYVFVCNILIRDLTGV